MSRPACKPADVDLASPGRQLARATIAGKFLEAAGERLWIKGVTYGTFAPDATGRQFPSLKRLQQDFSHMRQVGLNAIRTYTAPDRRVLDMAAEHGLRVIVGLAWPQHVAFLDDRRLRASIRAEVMAQVRALASHPAVLLFVLGNEIPASVVRWHGHERVERFLRDLHSEAKVIAPESLFTYVNYPPTDYLNLSFVDLFAFNIYLHRGTDLRAYLARLQNMAGHKPLLLAEAGADSVREGLAGQATLTAMQLRAAFAGGACGAIAFAWTDEWWRGGGSVDDWAFGLVDAERRPKPALQAVGEVFASVPFPPPAMRTWPKVSVVVCAYNAADTIDDCLESLERLCYPHFEVIVINDGSCDATGDLARAHAGVQVIDVPNGGLSAARNLGLAVATGEIVAYTDADVRVDPDWLTYLIQPFLTSDVVGAGGPNVVPPDNPWVAQCVARSPGGPTHVLLDDRTAEHVPGCNMAFRRDVLRAIGGFNPIYVRAGDDVDVCWRLQACGLKIGFAPAALVWHHHRASVRAYWSQQVGYGEGEAWLVPHHPQKFAGRKIAWRGHVYSPLPFVRALSRPRINTGVWGTAAFPSVYHMHSYAFAFLPHSVRWQTAFVLLILAGLAGLVSAQRWGVPLAAAGLAGLSLTVARCIRYALASDIRSLPPIGRRSRRTSRALYRSLIAWLHLIQPFARAHGRIRGMLSPPPVAPVRARSPVRAPTPSLADLGRTLWAFVFGRAAPEVEFWSERWIDARHLLTGLADQLRVWPETWAVQIDDGWRSDRDIRLAIGSLAHMDLRLLVEEHAGGRCLVRIAQRLRPSALAVAGALAVGVWSVAMDSGGGISHVQAIGAAGAVTVLAFLGTAVWRSARALAGANRAIAELAAKSDLCPLPIAGVDRSAQPHVASASSQRRAPVATTAGQEALVRVTAPMALDGIGARASAVLTLQGQRPPSPAPPP